MDAHLKQRLEVITGCMYCGKTEELIRRLQQAEHAKINILIFKPFKDDRKLEEIDLPVGVEKVIGSRNGKWLEAVEVKSATEILDHVSDEHQWIGIDEAHFFGADLVSVAMKLVRAGKRVIVAGLDLDSSEVPFEVVAQLMALATDIQKLYGVCSVCGSLRASRSHRISDKRERIVVGSDDYEPRCLKCFVPPSV